MIFALRKNAKIISVSALFLSVLIIFQFNSCSLIGFGIGSISDASKPDQTTIPTPKIVSVKPGSMIEVILSDKRSLEGKYSGLTPIPLEKYSQKYVKSREQMSQEIILPALGERITIETEAGKSFEYEFLGFDYNYISIREIGKTESTKQALSKFKDIKDSQRNVIDAGAVRKLIAEGRIPLLSSISVQSVTGLVEVPLDEVYQIKIPTKKHGKWNGLLIGAILDAGIIVLNILSMTEEKEMAGAGQTESCPFIYSFDGEQYVFDAEPYGGAICQGLKRGEWCELDHLKEVNGQYKIMIANELNETQYTDEIKLVTVDHPKGAKVAPDISGRIHTFSRPDAPSKAYDSKGKDILPMISANDRSFWLSQLEGRNPEKKEDLRDELIIEFRKPTSAKRAKLLANAWTTQWGSQVAKQFLQLFGAKLPEWYEEVNSLGPAYQQIWNWYLSEELYLLKVWVETKDGWKAKGMIYGGGPFVSKDKAYLLDISDVPGAMLRIKLNPPAGFWILNYLAVDYTEDLPVKVTEIGSIQALNQNRQDVRELLSTNDNKYLIMPKVGDRTEVVFIAPPQNKELERSIVLKASGYYDIHFEAKGEQQKEMISRIFNEPGYTLQFAFKELLKSKEKNRMKN